MRVYRFCANVRKFAGIRVEKLHVSFSVKPIGTGVYKRVHNRRRPSQYRCYRVQSGCLDLVVHDVDQHEWQKAQQEAQKNSEHKFGNSRVFSALKSTVLSTIGMSFQGHATRSHAPINAQVRDNYHQARYHEAQNEEKLFRAGTIFLQDRTGERRGVQTKGTPDSEPRRNH